MNSKIVIDLNEYAKNPLGVLQRLNTAVIEHGLKKKTIQKTRQQQILEYLLTGKPLSQLEATALGYGTRLGAIVWILKKQGIPIEKFTTSDKVSTGQYAHYANYFLPKTFIEQYKRENNIES